MKLTNHRKAEQTIPLTLHSKGFWRLCMVLKFTGFLDFVHRPVFYILENTTFRELNLFPSSGEEREAHTTLGVWGEANLNNWSTNTCPSIIWRREEGHFPKCCSLLFLERREMDKVQNHSQFWVP
jgi:hypothetical protein